MSRWLRRWIIIAIVVLLLAALCAGGLWFWNAHVFVDGQVYPKNADTLDLRGTGITPEHYQKVHALLPDCEILWDVPFQGAYYAQDTREMTLTSLTEGDIAALDCFARLERVDAENCSDYAMLAALKQRRPEVEVTYTVTVNGRMYPSDARKLILTDITEEELALLQWLPELTAVDATAVTDLELIPVLAEALPHCDISYQVPLGGEYYPHTADSLTLTGADPEELAAMLPWLPQVKTVRLTDPIPKAEALLSLPERFPGIAFSWESHLYGTTVTQTATLVDLTDIPLESTDSLKAALACYPNVETVILSGCGLDNETLAAFREAHRAEYKVIWTVRLGTLNVRTDAVYYIPVKYGSYALTDAQVENLRYCEDMVCIDLGHNEITHCDWAAYMPKLKYLVLADAPVKDISGLEGRTQLVFLELFLTQVQDLSPLESCTALEDLNLSYTWCYPGPVSRMPWLKRLWWAQCPWGQSAFRKYLPDTELGFIYASSTGGSWREGQNYYDMRDLVGMGYMTG